MTAIGERLSLDMPPDGEFRWVNLDSPNKMFEAAISPAAIHIRASYSAIRGTMPGEMLLFKSFLSQSPGIARYFGYVVQASLEGFMMRAPNVAELNAKKALLSKVTGVNTASFVGPDADIIPNPEYLGYFPERKMPFSQRPTGAVHDTAAHVLGFAVTNNNLSESKAEAAERAIVSDNPGRIDRAVQLIDGLSALLVTRGGYVEAQDLQRFYAKYAPEVLTGSRAARDAMSQTVVMGEINQFLQGELRS